MIKTSELSKIFKTSEVETTALNKVDLEVRQGEFIAIMGPSGCGKSTLLNTLGLLDDATSGDYFLNGINVSGYSENKRTEIRRGNIGFVFQSFNLFSGISAWENVSHPLIPIGVGTKQRFERAVALLERLGLQDRVDYRSVQHAPAASSENTEISILSALSREVADVRRRAPSDVSYSQHI